MEEKFYSFLRDVVGRGEILRQEDALRVLDVHELDTLELVRLAYVFRQKYFGRTVMLHILNNVQNGLCTEDCRYCAQSASSSAKIEEYPMKSDAEILAEAAAAHAGGAGRYCMVFSGTGPSDERIEHLVKLIRTIKQHYPLEVCVSPGLVNESQAKMLKDAGLDRLNHNLNTSPEHYHHICSTHTYDDRMSTLKAAHAVGLPVCSGVIIGMGESCADVYSMARSLRELGAESIPVNFLIPIPGIALKQAQGLTPEYCLRVLCLFRLLNPSAEIRMAAGREIHLGALQSLGLYAANSLFLQGYLNVKGASDKATLKMILDLGFTIKSDVPLETLVHDASDGPEGCCLKNAEELRPFN